MKNRTTEQVKRFCDQFMSEHEKGLSIPEIAYRYGISKVSAYNNLELIAKKQGMSREDLLQRIPSKYQRVKNPENNENSTDFRSTEFMLSMLRRRANVLLAQIEKIETEEN